MKKEKKTKECCAEGMIFKRHHSHRCHDKSEAIYGLGVVGALFYFLQSAATFGMVIMGIIKSFFWPAILMYELLSYLQL